ncbi:photosystem reaction center subunit H [Pedobacter sp. P351]|uniref:photosystem reaction center subunit H n=1 Tax=Pedobacter superstes TaxID=3133441 RepID=UPI0030B2737E
MSDENRDLYYLHELSDYKVASDYSDVRGWKVKDSGNRTIGIIDGLLVSKKAERVIYLDVEIDESVIEDSHKAYEVPASAGTHEFLNSDGDTHLIIPIGLASLNEKMKTVCAEQLDYSTFIKAKRFRKGAIIAPEYELYICRHYTGDNSLNDTTIVNASFYDRPEFNNKEVLTSK